MITVDTDSTIINQVGMPLDEDLLLSLDILETLVTLDMGSVGLGGGGAGTLVSSTLVFNSSGSGCVSSG